MTTTDRDRETAAKLAHQAWWAGATLAPVGPATEAFAAALAAERDRVLAPVLAVAAELEAEGAALQAGPGRSAWLHGQRALDAAARIRRAAQDGAE